MRLAARSLPVLLFLYSYGDQRALPSFPTRRSSDLPSSVPPSGGLSSRGPARGGLASGSAAGVREGRVRGGGDVVREMPLGLVHSTRCRSEEHTSELQSRGQLLCRLLLEKERRPRLP